MVEGVRKWPAVWDSAMAEELVSGLQRARRKTAGFLEFVTDAVDTPGRSFLVPLLQKCSSRESGKIVEANTLEE